MTEQDIIEELSREYDVPVETVDQVVDLVSSMVIDAMKCPHMPIIKTKAGTFKVPVTKLRNYFHNTEPHSESYYRVGAIYKRRLSEELNKRKLHHSYNDDIELFGIRRD